MPIRSRTADESIVTTPETTDVPVAVDDPTALDTAFAAALDAVSRLHDDALAAIAALADAWDTPADEVRVLRRAELPTVTQRVDAAA